MANKRIKDISTASTSFASDDFVITDSATSGTRKMTKDNLISQVSAGVSGDYLEESNNLSDVASKDTAKLNLEIPDIGLQPNQVPLSGMLNSGAWLDFDAFFSAGTWTPTVSFGGASNGTYNIQEGGYQKTGQLVHVWCQVNNVTKHATNTGNVTVDGLPYTAAGSNVPYVGSAALHNAASLSGQTVTLIAGGTNSAMIFDSSVNGTSAITDVNYNSSTIIRISITYKIA